VHKQKLYHTRTDAYLTQKETEYSLQAIYDELKRAESNARTAQTIHKKAQQITQSQTHAKQLGHIYTLSTSERQTLIEDAKYFNGGRYIWGGTTPDGFDCSGYVQYLYKKHHINLPRTAWAQSKRGIPVSSENLQKGDLLFFLTDKKRGIPVTHVGIYLGDGNFIHAASKKKGIIISPLFSGHYARTFVSAKRILNQNS
jgi:cell wall-associated NlpC family hydrolase